MLLKKFNYNIELEKKKNFSDNYFIHKKIITKIILINQDY